MSPSLFPDQERLLKLPLGLFPSTTNANGQVSTLTVQSTQFIVPTQTVAPSPTSSSSSSTGAIAGGVVGAAIAVFAVIVAIFFFLKRRKGNDDFDGNFDPDRLDTERLGGNARRPGAMPDIDLDGAEVTPFQFHHQGAQQQGYSQYPQMAPQMPPQMPPQMAPQMVQRPGMPAPVVGAGAGGSGHDGYSTASGSNSHYPTTVTDQSVSGMQNPDWRGPSPGPSLGTSGTLLSTKDREMADERRRLYVANEERGEGGSTRGSGGGGGGGGGVVQHRDGGRVQEPTVPDEVPPSYDSIPPDEQDAPRRG